MHECLGYPSILYGRYYPPLVYTCIYTTNVLLLVLFDNGTIGPLTTPHFAHRGQPFPVLGKVACGP
ncbi:hypothetical protein C8Q79DRAFT_756710 [Trametes meyenii]|nr:hypothetical protein C8Q79DRAFT_756710 [Trametes meyenii]